MGAAGTPSKGRVGVRLVASFIVIVPVASPSLAHPAVFVFSQVWQDTLENTCIYLSPACVAHSRRRRSGHFGFERNKREER